MTAMKEWRARMGWSQRRAAQELGVTLPTYQSWERGVRLSDGSAIDPPLTALLAAAAREAGVPPVGVDCSTV